METMKILKELEIIYFGPRSNQVEAYEPKYLEAGKRLISLIFTYVDLFQKDIERGINARGEIAARASINLIRLQSQCVVNRKIDVFREIKKEVTNKRYNKT